MKHSSSFFYDLDFAETAEDWVKKLFTNGFKVEVKYDRMAHITGKIYVEVYSSNKPSGISTTQAQYWIFVIDKKDYALIVNTENLKELCRIAFQVNGYTKGGDENTSLGILIPINQIV